MRKVFSILDKIIPKAFQIIALWFGGLCIIVLTIGTAWEVIARYLFNAPTSWSIELTEHLMAILTFLSGAFVLVLDAHVRADAFYRKFTGKTKASVDIFIYFICIIYLGTLTWQSSLYSRHLLATWARSSGGVMLPLFPAQFTATLGAFFTCVECLRKMVHSIMALREE